MAARIFGQTQYLQCLLFPSASDHGGPALTLEAHVSFQARCVGGLPREELLRDRQHRDSPLAHTSSSALPPTAVVSWRLSRLRSACPSRTSMPARAVGACGDHATQTVRLVLRAHPSWGWQPITECCKPFLHWQI